MKNNMLPLNENYIQKIKSKYNDEQQEAIFVDKVSALVSAGAGSGKTAVLSERTIALLKAGFDISRILILTFTDNAAQNMKIRIKAKISEDKDGDIKEAEKYVSGADIMTFDSFNRKLAIKYGPYLGLESGYEIINDSALNVIKFNYIKSFLDEKIEQKDPDILFVLDRFTNKDYKPIVTLISEIYGKIDLLVDPEKKLEKFIAEPIYKNIDEVYQYHFDNIMRYLNEYYKEMHALFNNDEKMLKKIEDFKNAYSRANDYSELKIISQTLKAINKPRGIDDLTYAEFQAIKKRSFEKYKDLIGIIDKDQFIKIEENYKGFYIKIFNFVKDLFNYLNRYKEEQRKFTFQDISHKILHLLKTNEEIRLELKNHYQEIMVDEYQDNSDIQEEMIDLLENDNLFLVGDIKQSIYRFRNANPKLFSTRYNDYKEGRRKGIVIDMNKNYRSSPAVINDVNYLFARIMSQNFGGIEYDDKQKMSSENAMYKGKTYYNELKVVSDNGDRPLETELNAIADDIKKKISTGIYDYKDFAIILDRSTEFDDIIEIMTKNGIPVAANYNGNLLDKVISNLLIDIVKILACFSNNDFWSADFKNSFVAISRSYIIGLSDEEIENYISTNSQHQTPWVVDLFGLYSEMRGRTTYEIFEASLSQLNVLNSILKDENYSVDLVILEKIEDYIKELSSLNYGFNDIIDYFEDIKENNISSKGKFLSEKTNAVTLINTFLSKGLEYRHCYFPYLYKEYNEKETVSALIFSTKYGIMHKFAEEDFNVDKFNSDNYLNPIKELDKIDSLNQGRQEKVRLLYVALTRPKESFTIVRFIKNKKNDEAPKSIDQIKCLEGLLDYSGFFEYMGRRKANTEIVENKKEKLFENIDYHFSYEELSEKEIEEIFSEKKDIYITASSSSVHSDTGVLLKGTKLHEMFENIDLKNPQLDKNEENYIFISKFLNCGLLDDIKDADVYQEFAFVDNENNTTGIIDLLLVYQDKIKIIDYKTKNLDDPHYIEQLHTYRNAIRQYFGENIAIGTYLYSIIDGVYKSI